MNERRPEAVVAPRCPSLSQREERGRLWEALAPGSLKICCLFFSVLEHTAVWHRTPLVSDAFDTSKPKCARTTHLAVCRVLGPSFRRRHHSTVLMACAAGVWGAESKCAISSARGHNRKHSHIPSAPGAGTGDAAKHCCGPATCPPSTPQRLIKHKQHSGRGRLAALHLRPRILRRFVCALDAGRKNPFRC